MLPTIRVPGCERHRLAIDELCERERTGRDDPSRRDRARARVVTVKARGLTFAASVNSALPLYHSRPSIPSTPSASYQSADTTKWPFSPIGMPYANSACWCSWSPRSVWPDCTLPLMPSKSVFKMKFVTPLIASEPYAADAPPVTTSTRSMSAVGKHGDVDRAGLLAADDAPAVEQRERAVRADAAQVHGVRAAARGEYRPRVRLRVVAKLRHLRRANPSSSVGAISRISSLVTAVTGVGVSHAVAP